MTWVEDLKDFDHGVSVHVSQRPRSPIQQLSTWRLGVECPVSYTSFHGPGAAPYHEGDGGARAF